MLRTPYRRFVSPPQSHRSELMPPSRRAHSSPRPRGRHLRPMLEVLEGRLAPASIITVVPTGTGSLDGFLSPTDGTITTSDGGNTPGTLSVGALKGVNSNVDISISALHQLDFT